MPDELQGLDPPAVKQIIAPGYTFGTVTDQIAAVVLTKKTPTFWMVSFGIGFALLLVFLWSLAMLLAKGVGIWGIRTPVMWGFAITNFVWWIGIGHAGTLISAILLLLNQSWRNSINRFAEAMTLFAVACAGVFPLLHLGRPWLFYWLFPYPNTMGVQPNFRSPLVWDVFAVSTYATVSLLFWYVGLMPDLATLRDRATKRSLKLVYGIGAMGWRGSAKHWAVYETASLLLAGLATPLVLSVHTVVSFDFTIAIVPGWHSTFFPPYFVAGAIYSGFAMVLALAIPLRKAYGLEGLITAKHLDNSAKVMLATGLIVAYAYIMETFAAWYTSNVYRARGHLESHERAIPLLLLVSDHMQCRRAEFSVDKEISEQPVAALYLVACGLGRYVAGTLRHHREQPGAGLPALVLGDLRSHPVGLGYLFRHYRAVPFPFLPVYSPLAYDLDLRSSLPCFPKPKSKGG